MRHRAHLDRQKEPARKWLLFIPAVLLLLLQTIFNADLCQAGVTVSASLNTSQFPMDRVAILSVDVSGARSADIDIEEIDNLRFHPRGESTQVQMTNGSFTSSVSSRYLIQALKPGKYTIPPITVRVDGDKYLTQALSFEVTRTNSSVSGKSIPGSSTARIGSGKAEELAFLRIEKLKDTSYTGEIIPIDIKAYFRQGIRVKLTAFPVLKGDGFVMPPQGQEPLQTVEQINNTSYSVITWQSSLSAVKEGKHPLSMELEATLLIPQRNRRSSTFGNRGFFQDDFFDDFFGNYQSKTVTLASPEIELDALPLPLTGKPKDFSGAIGDFSLHIQADPTDVEVGEPITLTMTIAGRGNFDRVTAPHFPEQKDWKSYSPSSEFLKDGSNYRGKKQFEQAIVLKNNGTTAIPPLSFVYFDPGAGKYITRTSTPIPLTVKNGYEDRIAPVPAPLPSPTAQKVGTETVPHGIEGLAPIHLNPGRLTPEIRPLFFEKWYLVLIGLCVFSLLFILSLKLRNRHLKQNPLLVKRKLMEKQLTKSLQHLEEVKAVGESRKFLNGCRKAIQEQFGLAWEMEPSAITLEDLNRKLSSSSPLLAIFAAAESSAYGGLALSQEDMTLYHEQLQKELGGIQ